MVASTGRKWLMKSEIVRLHRQWLRPAAWVVLDDETACWTVEEHREHIVLTDGCEGLREPRAQDRLMTLLVGNFSPPRVCCVIACSTLFATGTGWPDNPVHEPLRLLQQRRPGRQGPHGCQEGRALARSKGRQVGGRHDAAGGGARPGARGRTGPAGLAFLGRAQDRSCAGAHATRAIQGSASLGCGQGLRSSGRPRARPAALSTFPSAEQHDGPVVADRWARGTCASQGAGLTTLRVGPAAVQIQVPSAGGRIRGQPAVTARGV